MTCRPVHQHVVVAAILADRVEQVQLQATLMTQDHNLLLRVFAYHTEAKLAIEGNGMVEIPYPDSDMGQ